MMNRDAINRYATNRPAAVPQPYGRSR